MKSKGMLLTAALSMLMLGTAQAQNDKVLKSYSFVEAQGGVQLTSTDAPMDKLITPTAALSFGHYFSPVVGARLHVNAWEAKSGFESMDKYYKWKYVTPNLDLMLNLTNLFGDRYNASHFLNVVLLGGVGLNYAWDNKELKELGLTDSQMPPLAWGIKNGSSDNRLSHNLRAGLRLETDVTKPLGVSLEVNANSLSDRFNSKSNDADDWQFTAMLGLSFRFNHKYKDRYIYKTVEVIDTVEVDEPEVIKVKKTRPVVKEKMEKTKMQKAIFFKIAESDADVASGINTAIREAAELMKTSDDAVITVTGYADKGTGTAAGNKKFAKKRAQDVARKLTDEYGLDKTRITVDSKGDTVQPFEDNDKNRCVIVEGDGTFRVQYTVQEEYEEEQTITKKVKKTVTRQIQIKEEAE